MAIVIIFSLIFTLILLLLFTGSYHRSVVAMLGALLVIAFGWEYGIFSPQSAADYVFKNAETIVLVIGSMILCEALGRSGLFQFIGLSLISNIGKSIRWFTAIMLLLTVILSAFLNNITAMLIIGALTLSLEKRLELDLSELIIYEAIFTNIGGLMLMISSIPNLIVAGEFGIGFSSFAATCIPLTLLLTVVSIYLVIKRMKNVTPLKEDLEINPWSAVKDKRIFYRASLIFTLVMILFVLNDVVHIGLGLIAIAGATAMLILSGEEPESVFRDIDWGTIFFLVSFYVIIGGMEQSGVLTLFAQDLSMILAIIPAIAYFLNIWISGAASAFIDNIPITITLIPIVKYLSSSLGLSLGVLAWSMVFGANLGGNFTPIGSPSIIIATGMLKKKGMNIGFHEWIKKYGIFPAIHLLLASIYTVLLVVI
ncbi:hypothetical protein DRO54_02595 [Candidatus Bathyarchaeota archaeon]|nr:MAG: hypothetical protein DRO54_02595 [Candidatus Bathyarchaeota archaeon]